jgi:hypothetical protein
MAFMTSKNNPKVKMVTGNVNKIKTGFTKKFKSASTIATFKAEENPSMITPFKK